MGKKRDALAARAVNINRNLSLFEAKASEMRITLNHMPTNGLLYFALCVSSVFVVLVLIGALGVGYIDGLL